MRRQIHTPEGTRDRLYEECRERRGVQSKLTKLFANRGYSEIITPEVEYYDLFVRSGNPMPQEQFLKIIDRSGKILVMRPDCTTPIARAAVGKLGETGMPGRFYYNQTVFRSGSAHHGGSNEIAQCGIELLGAAGRKADLEVITMAVDALRSCGLEHFYIELGHAGLFRALISDLPLGEGEAETLRTLAENKNFAAMGDLLTPYRETEAGRILGRLPYLFGGGEVLDEAKALIGDRPGREAVDHLEALWNGLSTAGCRDFVRFDLGLVHPIDYYTGVIFRGYAEGAGGAVLSGGRYDALIGAFGPETPATGFAIDVDAVAGCRPSEETQPPRTIIHCDECSLRLALDRLDAMGKGEGELSLCDTLEETERLARARGIPEILILENGAERRMTL